MAKKKKAVTQEASNDDLFLGNPPGVMEDERAFFANGANFMSGAFYGDTLQGERKGNRTAKGPENINCPLPMKGSK
jgi:hypothetical protein